MSLCLLDVFVYLGRLSVTPSLSKEITFKSKFLENDRVRVMDKRAFPSRSEGFAFTGYNIPGCVEDGAWMLWENSSVGVTAAVVVVVAHPGLGRAQLSVLLRLRRFRDARIDPSRLPRTDGPNFMESCRRKVPNIKKQPRNKHKLIKQTTIKTWETVENGLT